MRQNEELDRLRHQDAGFDRRRSHGNLGRQLNGNCRCAGFHDNCADGDCRLDDPIEARRPIATERNDGRCAKLCARSRQDKMECRVRIEQRFGDQDVGAGGQRAIAEADIFVADRISYFALQGFAGNRQGHVTGEVKTARRAKCVEPGFVLAQFVENQCELPQRGRVIFIGLRRACDGCREFRLRPREFARQKKRFGARGGAIIGRLVLVFVTLQNAECEDPSSVALTREQGERRRIDERISRAAEFRCAGIGVCCLEKEPYARVAFGGTCTILEQATSHAEHGGIVIDAFEPRLLEHPPRAIQRTGPRVRDDGEEGGNSSTAPVLGQLPPQARAWRRSTSVCNIGIDRDVKSLGGLIGKFVLDERGI